MTTSPTGAEGTDALFRPDGDHMEIAFGSGFFINPDVPVSIHRPPTGEWVCLEARTRFGGSGIGAAESALGDVDGRVGQSHLVEVAP